MVTKYSNLVSAERDWKAKFVYILQSEKDSRYYIGCTSDLNVRLAWHNDGKNKSTSYRRPLRLVYNEELPSKTEALKRERQIKLYKGGNEFKELIKQKAL